MKGYSKEKLEKKRGMKPEEEKSQGEEGRYHNDYSPRYQAPYDIYEKAKNHARSRRKADDHKSDSGKS